VVAAGAGFTLGEALLRLTAPRAPAPEEYADEAPFWLGAGRPTSRVEPAAGRGSSRPSPG